MNIYERIPNSVESARIIAESERSKTWTALPGYVVKYTVNQNTCDVQPTIPALTTATDGTVYSENMPVLLDCPVVFPSGGGYSLTFPIAVNDEVLVVFSSRCIDGWWYSSGIQGVPEFRMHDLSDGFVIPGPFSKPKVFTNISTASTQLRSMDGNTFVEIKGNVVNINCQTANVNASDTNINGNALITGNLQVNGTITGNNGISITAGNANFSSSNITTSGTITGSTISTNGVNLTRHVHSDPQGGTTGGPQN